MNKIESAECGVAVSDESDLQLACGEGGPVYEISATDTEDDDETTRMNVYVR
jgi:hypothetical protein